MAEANYCIPLENLLEPLTPIADHWRNLAVALDVPQEAITLINIQYAGNATDCLQSLLEWWSKKQTDKQNAWKALIDALQKHGHEKISKSLADKYLSSTDQKEQTSQSLELPEIFFRHPSTGEITEKTGGELGDATAGQTQSNTQNTAATTVTGEVQHMTERSGRELEGATSLQHTAATTNHFRGVLANDICAKLGPPQTSNLKFMCRSIIPHATLARIDGSLEVLAELMSAGKLSPTQLDLMTEIFRILGWDIHLRTLQDAGFNIPENVECDDINTREFIFTKYLMKIAQGLTDEEVQQLGFTIINQWKGMGAQTQQYSAIQLFVILNQRRIITPYHVARLHHELHELKREDLCQHLEEYIIETKQYMPQLLQLSEGHYFGPVLEPSAEVYRQLQTPDILRPEGDPEQLLKEIQDYEAETVEAETKIRALMERIKKQTQLVEVKTAELKASEESLSALEKELDCLQLSEGKILKTSEDSMLREQVQLLQAENEKLKNRLSQNIAETHDQETFTAITTAYLRGVNVIGETNFLVTNKAQTLHWEGHGLKLHIPPASLPPDVRQTCINIKASLAGQFQFPGNTTLVSAVYWIQTPVMFLQPVTLEIQHCAKSTTDSPLNFAVAKCSQKDLPYQFKPLQGGAFSSNTSYGSIPLLHFSGLGITQEGSEEQLYCAKQYYVRSQINWNAHFVVTKDLEVYITAVNKEYSGGVKGPYQRIEFAEDKITLEIAEDGLVTQDGWSIRALTPLTITRREVDCYECGRHIPSCQLQVKQIKEQQKAELYQRVKLQGAKEPYNFIVITIESDLLPSSPGAGFTDTQTTPQLTDLTAALCSRVADRWNLLGIYLRIPKATLDAISVAKHDKPENCLVEMLDCWLKTTNPSPTWAAIAEATELLGNRHLAEELRSKHCSP